MRITKERRAQVGIGTLIIFIAMILVAAVAAGVLLRTSGSLQTKATATGEQATAEVSTALKVTDIVLECDTTGTRNNATNVSLTARLAAGSGDVNYDDLIVSFQSGNTYISGIGYGGLVATYNGGHDNNASTFLVNRLKDSTADTVLESGEIVEIKLHLYDQYAIYEDTDFQITLTPESGQSVTVKKTTPKSITQNRYVL